ncbi:MAG: DUF2851 family protein [Bacteroidota bacterium]|nr:DUF2851 family protein [Bacteroidota bacterium]
MNSSPHEDILRHLWAKQYFDTGYLTTSDGGELRILNPGTLHRGSGPDFRDAVIMIDGTTYCGDIEFHRTLDDWNAHKHSNNRSYNSVILHVVLRGSHVSPTLSASGRKIPVLILEPFLAAPLEAILEHTVRDETVSRSSSIPCAYNERHVSSATAERWLRTLFLERMKEKTKRLQTRLAEIIEELAAFRQSEGHQRIVFEPNEEYGEGNPDEIPVPDFCCEKGMLNKLLAWEQLLYEVTMGALGFSQNRPAFKKLSRIVPLWLLKRRGTKALSLLDLEAVFLKTSGLLPSPSETNNQQARIFVHQLHTALHALDFVPHGERMNASEWIFSPTRPSNFPTIRIAAASALAQKILYEELFRKIILTFSAEPFSADEAGAELDSLLATEEDPFWSVHYSFNETAPRAHALLGKSRRLDVIINSIIPLCCLYAETFGKHAVENNALLFALIIGASEENSTLRKMKKQLPVESLEISRTYQQQGAIQLYKHYCMKQRCAECDIGAVVLSDVEEI